MNWSSPRGQQMSFHLTDHELQKAIERVISSLNRIIPVRTESDLRCAFVTGLTFLVHQTGGSFDARPWSLVTEHHWRSCDNYLDLAIYNADRVRFIVEFKHQTQYTESHLISAGRDVARLAAILQEITWRVDFYQVLGAYVNSSEAIRAQRYLQAYQASVGGSSVTFHTHYVVLDPPTRLPQGPLGATGTSSTSAGSKQGPQRY